MKAPTRLKTQKTKNTQTETVTKGSGSNPTPDCVKFEPGNVEVGGGAGEKQCVYTNHKPNNLVFFALVEPIRETKHVCSLNYLRYKITAEVVGNSLLSWCYELGHFESKR